MIRKDDRTPEQQKTHTWLVVGTDSFLSGWGLAENGTSIAAWAVDPTDFHGRADCLDWVSNRGDMKRVREVSERDRAYRPNCAHLHIYVWRGN